MKLPHKGADLVWKKSAPAQEVIFVTKAEKEMLQCNELLAFLFNMWSWYLYWSTNEPLAPKFVFFDEFKKPKCIGKHCLQYLYCRIEVPAGSFFVCSAMVTIIVHHNYLPICSFSASGEFSLRRLSRPNLTAFIKTAFLRCNSKRGIYLP